MTPKSNDLHSRIAGLLRKDAGEGGGPGPRHDPPERVRTMPVAREPLDVIPVPTVPRGATVEEVFPGGVRAGELGTYYLCTCSVGELLPEGASLAARVRSAMSARNQDDGHENPHLAGLRGVPPEGLLFLDLETAGLSSAPLFLVGVLRLERDELLVEQSLARDYAEEAAMLWELGESMQSLSTLVTFNGKSFDVPYIRDRMTYYHLPWQESFEHIDLLHASRRRWKGRFPDCKLQTLEERVCGRTRLDDVPGELIPEKYHEFVATQDASIMAPILHHNWLDLVTMVEILCELLSPDDSAGGPVAGSRE